MNQWLVFSYNPFFNHSVDCVIDVIQSVQFCSIADYCISISDIWFPWLSAERWTSRHTAKTSNEVDVCRFRWNGPGDYWWWSKQKKQSYHVRYCGHEYDCIVCLSEDKYRTDNDMCAWNYVIVCTTTPNFLIYIVPEKVNSFRLAGLKLYKIIKFSPWYDRKTELDAFLCFLRKFLISFLTEAGMMIGEHFCERRYKNAPQSY